MSRRRTYEPDAAEAADLSGAGQAPDRRSGRDDERERPWIDEDFTAAADLDSDAFAADEWVGGPGRAAILPAIRRRAWHWGTIALIGLVLGIGAYAGKPPPHKAATTVLLQQGGASLAADQMLTDVALAQSRTVAAAAMRRLGLPVTGTSVLGFIGQYTVTSITDRVLQITAKASTDVMAARVAHGVAAAFLQVLGSELHSQLALTTAALNTEIGQDQQHANSLAARITALSAGPASAARQAELASLQARQREASTTWKGLVQAAGAYEASTKVANESMAVASRVLDVATPLPRSHLKYPVLYIGGGLVGGLAVGLGLVVMQALVSTRPRRRDDVAQALGAPVRLSVGRVPLRRWPGRSPLAAAQGSRVRRIVAHLRRAVPEGSGVAALAVIAADNPAVAAVSVVSLAVTCAREGKHVVIADLSRGVAAGRLLGVTEPGVSKADVDGQEVLVAVPEPGDLPPAGPVGRTGSAVSAGPVIPTLDSAMAAADVLLTLATLDPAVGGDHMASWADAAIVMATAGRCSAARISAVGDMIRLAGVPLSSAVLVSADRSDESLGALAVRGGDTAADTVQASRTPDAVERLAVT